MCDTLVCLPSFSKSGHLIFGKNSDREPMEAQAITHVPRKQPESKELTCTFITIPQVRETFEVILSRPFQMWGAEMGVNEFGVVIGNEAVFTNVKFDKSDLGLTGMDLLRLGLERSKTALEAVQVIIKLLEEFGQNACGGYQNKNFYYHNSFLIADPNHAFILDTAGKSWAYQSVEKFGTISNALSIESNYEAASFVNKPRTIQGIFAGQQPNFRRHFSDFVFTTAGRANQRKTCTLTFLEKAQTPSTSVFFQGLRQHNREDFSPQKATTGSICMHATGFTNPSDTTGSMVAEIRKGEASTIWLTGTSHPCMSIYIPFFLGAFPTEAVSLLNPSAQEDGSLWWKAKKVHALIEKNYTKNQPIWRKTLDQLQENWLEEEIRLIQSEASLEELKSFTSKCLNTYLEVLNQVIQTEKLG